MLALRLPSLVRPPRRGLGVARPLPRPVRRGRAARTAVVLGLVLFFGVQAATNLALRREWVSIRDPLYIEKFWLLRTFPAFFPAPADPPADRPATVLFVGSSRTLNGVNAARLTESLSGDLGRPVAVFNFGMAGCGPVTNALYLRRLVDDGARADFVVIEIHPAFLAGHHADPFEVQWLLPTRFRPDEFATARELGFPAAVPSTHGPRSWVASWYEYRRIILDRWFPFLLLDGRINAGHEPDGYGFCRLSEWMNEQDRAGLMTRTLLQYGPHMPGFRPGGPGVAAIRESLVQCRRMGCRAAILVTPESSQFRGWYPPEGRAALDAVLHNMAAEFGVPLVDATTWVPDDLVLDGHHLTGPGADALSDRLGREFLGPWLKANPNP